MGNPEELSPYAARDAAGFVVSMRRLKERAGLTYRELEERAAGNGDVLARSTLADVLRRTSLPRPDVLAAFVRACGDGKRVDAWLDARERIASDPAAARAGAGTGTAVEEARADTVAAATGTGADTGTAVPAVASPAPPPDADSPGARPHRRAGVRTALLAAVLTVPLLTLAAWALLPGGLGDSGAPAAAPADGWVTLRPLRTPDLCLTDGRDRVGAYPHAVAVQLPCARATVPRTYLEPAGEDLYHIQWHHPQEGKGCLTVVEAGPVKGMLEPRNDCAGATLFRVEAASDDDGGGFRLSPAHSSKCIGMSEGGGAAGVEAVEEPCTGAADQRFLVRAD
ncbi:helix-turn-helix domain-containing protein [Streptomyces sp. NPDC006527]|uniref:helix-turn-helix domain-containing protein n=1 Tax=Streptomyces sp. NPDC006527 TaxID=3364749 RepID=UPI0036BC158D